MVKGNPEVEDFLIQMAEDPAKFEEFKRDPNKVLSTFDIPDDIKLDIVSGKLENIRRDMHRGKHKPSTMNLSYGLNPDY